MDNLRVANLKDIPKIITILRETYSNTYSLPYILSQRMRLGTYWYLLDPEDTMVIIFEAIGETKCQFHIYSLKESRGKKLFDFAKDCSKFILDNTKMEGFLTFIKEDNRAAKLFARKMSLREVGKLNDECIYVTTRKEFVEKIR